MNRHVGDRSAIERNEMRPVARHQGVASQANGGCQHWPILVREQLESIRRQLSGLEWGHF